MPSAGQPIRKLRDWGILSLWSGWPGSPWARAPVLPVAPHPGARCSISAQACCRHLEFVIRSTSAHSPVSWSLGHNASVPGTLWESETILSTKEKTKKKVRVYYPDSIFIFWQLLMVITPGNQKNEGHYMRRDFRERRLKTKVWGTSTFNDWVIENFKTLHEIGRKIQRCERKTLLVELKAKLL